MTDILKLYAVRDATDLYWFGNKIRMDWVRHLEDARLYVKKSQARAMVTRFANGGLETELVELVVTEMRVVDEADRVAKAKQAKAVKEQQRKARSAKWELEEAEKKLKAATETIARLRTLGWDGRTEYRNKLAAEWLAKRFV